MEPWVRMETVIETSFTGTSINAISNIPYFSAYKTEAFPFQNNPKNLDPSYKILSYKMDLDI